MANSGIYTKKSFGLDKKVWLVMIITILLSLALLAYRMMDTRECTPIEFSIKSLEKHADNSFWIGETLSFTSTAKDDITWDFGDNTPKAYAASVTHIYLAEGTFTVTLTNGSACDTFQQVIVKKMVQAPISNVVPGTEISGTTNTVAGRSETFYCTILADNYEWTCTGINGTQQGSRVTFPFPVSGTYTVQVTLNHDRNSRFTKEILVHDSVVVKDPAEQTVEPLPAPVVKEYKIISPKLFKIYMEKVVSGEYTVDNFNDFLFMGGKTPVILNGEKDTPLEFAQVCQQLNGKRKSQAILWKRSIKIKDNVILHTEPNVPEHITLIELNYK